jgi:hypothetical protein
MLQTRVFDEDCSKERMKSKEGKVSRVFICRGWKEAESVLRVPVLG